MKSSTYHNIGIGFFVAALILPITYLIIERFVFGTWHLLGALILAATLFVIGIFILGIGDILEAMRNDVSSNNVTSPNATPSHKHSHLETPNGIKE